MIRAGELRNLVTIQTPTVTVTNGDPATTWATFSQVWAKVEPLSTGEQQRAAMVEAQLSHRITIRYLSGVLPTMRILWGTRIFYLVGPPRNVEERNEMLELVCKEAV